MVRSMRRGWGLRARMAGSYVLVTAAAVAVVEAVVLIVVVPGLLVSRQDAQVLVAGLTARDIATGAGELATQLGRLPDATEFPIDDATLPAPVGPAHVAVPGAATMSMALLADPSGRIVSSSDPARYPVGGRLDAEVLALFESSPKGYGGEGRDGAWFAVPVSVFRGGNREVLGLIYVQIPPTAKIKAPGLGSSGIWDRLSVQLGLGLLVLLGALPVGAVFGLLSTRRLLGRLRSLADSTDAVAAGDYDRRVPVAGGDEVGRLETGFNRMAERLADAMATERALAGAGERARIARELHDSISQDLFSLRLLAGGLRRALPDGSPMHPRVEAMERTVSGTLNEMQALLLELRPVALRGAGLGPALDELARAYRDRLGIMVETELEPVVLDPAAEPPLLRVAQEALANAVKHARPSTVVVRLARGEDGRIELSVRDDGTGFDPERAAERHGMGLGLMRERMAELGGELRVESAPGRGTTVRARLAPAA